MPDSYSDVRDHLRKFFDIVDKLTEMEINIDDDLPTVMMLYSLLSSYGNFRCAVGSRNGLSKPEELRIKIIEESDARRDDRQLNESGVFNAPHLQRKTKLKRTTEEINVLIRKIKIFRKLSAGNVKMPVIIHLNVN